MELLGYVCERTAQADLPQAIAPALLLSRLTALQRSGGRVRGVAAGCTFRRLVGKALARQIQEVFRTAVAPANFGLCDRSGTDALAHLLRAASEANPSIAIACVDGVGAFDHVLRSRIFGAQPFEALYLTLACGMEARLLSSGPTKAAQRSWLSKERGASRAIL